MNKHILKIIDNQMNPGKYNREQLRQNASEAADAYFDDYFATAYAATACAAYAANAAADATPDVVNYYIDQYFVEAKENKQDYIDEINTRGKNETDKY